MKLMLRNEAIDQKLKRYFTNCPCKHGHIAERLVSNYCCVVCHCDKTKKALKKGGSQYITKLQGVYRRRRKGGSQYENFKIHVKRRRKFSISPAAINLRLGNNLRNRLNMAIKSKVRVGSAVRDLGCSIAEFRSHIAKQFTKGMTWSNHGEWHLDHKRPLASFDLANRAQLLQACHYTNYQPLWAKDNLAKGSSYAC